MSLDISVYICIYISSYTKVYVCVCLYNYACRSRNPLCTEILLKGAEEAATVSASSELESATWIPEVAQGQPGNPT